MKNTDQSFIPFIVFVIASITAYLNKDHANIVSMCLFGAGAFLIILLHYLVPNLDPLDQFVSQYSLDDKNGTVMRIAFYLIAAGTFNLGFLIKDHYSQWVQFWIFMTGVFTILMGVFSQKSSSTDPIQNSWVEGTMHSISAGTSFACVAFSMLVFAISPSQEITPDRSWVRAVGLSIFIVTLMAVLVQLTLQLRKIKSTKSIEGLSLTNIIKSEIQFRNQILSIPLNKNREVNRVLKSNISERKNQSQEEIASLVAANQGLGITERILIFFFLEWAFFLSALPYVWGRL